MLQDGFTIDQGLNLIGEGIERLGQSLCEMEIAHPIDDRED